MLVKYSKIGRLRCDHRRTTCFLFFFGHLAYIWLIDFGWSMQTQLIINQSNMYRGCHKSSLPSWVSYMMGIQLSMRLLVLAKNGGFRDGLPSWWLYERYWKMGTKTLSTYEEIAMLALDWLVSNFERGSGARYYRHRSSYVFFSELQCLR